MTLEENSYFCLRAIFLDEENSVGVTFDWSALLSRINLISSSRLQRLVYLCWEEISYIFKCFLALGLPYVAVSLQADTAAKFSVFTEVNAGGPMD